MSESSTIKKWPPQYQVFMTSMGTATPDIFNLRLMDALKTKKISRFSYRDAYSGEGVVAKFKRGIEQSKIVLIFFSGKYEDSTFFLRQLKMIADRVEKGQLVAIPIFYKLDPSIVEDLRVQFSDATKTMGIVVNQESHDSEVIEEIVGEIRRVLEAISSENIGTVTYRNRQRFKKAAEKLDIRKIGQMMINICLLLLFSCLLYRTLMDGIGKPPQIQVFINFRGDELRETFVKKLVEALEKSKVNFFIDTRGQTGEDLNTLFKSIEDSGIAIVVFSTRYTESEWCLEELVKINERVDEGLLKVVPIFYNVPTDDVEMLTGEFGKHLRVKEYKCKCDEAKIKRWKKAIDSVSKKFALVYNGSSSGPENDAFVETTVKKVLEMLWIYFHS